MPVCPNCGFDSSAPTVKPMKNAMFNYRDKATGAKMICLNEDAVEVTIKNVVYVREDKWVAPKATVTTPPKAAISQPSVVASPIVPTAPTAPIVPTPTTTPTA